ncbi:SRPBCC family protein [Nocardia cyriacigeorgica]|uniref:Polyketide cyclase / dehydrase and lipid transport n=1 Tax=Nocardia cyriacigeorgica TaxID=135487 RepID=A0A4U8VWA2_9NOCA|nr:SRPBCC family protein [Nocardia cyriacigeorgica]MBF6093440.1 SRPBCC family protein [Nocardia cyriacigeorgica]MBF6157598.1 SRPBCC family protein [Nocardia cyriacigeorgica]MBF6196569.1 SRPBCC family protein [Nocardia cyriacigeorgica]MBF6318179.1 SRPBCC family protein [Nocardia cyriacigeorgica]MBF6345929.1 SRPBCC family protein [Nocardia cyriacigeorgica]
MADRTQRSIVIAAPSQQVMSVIADLASYPEWVSAAKSVEVLESGPDGRARTARFVLDAGVVKDTYVLSYTWRDDGKAVTWTLLSGDLQKAQDGSYELVDLPDGGTEVIYQLTVDLNIPMIGMFKRKAEKVITDTALKELKKRVEG